MKLLLCLCLALALALAQDPHGKKKDHHGQAGDQHGHGGDHHGHGGDHHGGALDRCKGIEMDAATENEEGIPYFFKGPHLYKGFSGKAELANSSFTELDDHHHLGHVDAALRMHYKDDPTHHDHIFLFLDNKVFSYYQHKLEVGYPKEISEVFPGIPNHLDAAVECPNPDCDEDSVIFFKGDDIYHFGIKSKKVVEKTFENMPNCTVAFRYLGHYYCFHGHKFSKFDPKTGEVHGKYPKEIRGYFVRCPKFGDDSNHLDRERCSHVHLDAITSDDAGNIYAFRGHHFIREDADKNITVDTIEKAFKELHSDVDAVFSYQNNLYMIKGHQLFVYRVGEPHTLLEGYPKPVKQELGIDGPIEAAFVCADHHIVHIIKEKHIYDVDLSVKPRVAANQRPLSHLKKVDAAMCGPAGVTAIVGNHFYRYQSTMIFVAGRILPLQERVSKDLLGCDH
ncbi:hemopexin [Austrofundulus limnaeus]|uniref:Hemopexin n=1 Tax=Austrofundulus limnaeus TaxID=52670 RepID=A0A2I4D1Q9_AUSLI|nr:PREDICTED: hemopexin-like [Austrofundulus limnaeus]